MVRFGIGQSAARREDDRFLLGTGRFVDDIERPNQAHAVLVRSPHAHARIAGLDVGAARAAPGVLAVLTGADYRAAGFRPLPCVIPLTSRDGTPRADPPRWPLAQDRVRYVGDPVVLVVAASRGAACDGADAVVVDYDPLPAVIGTAEALESGAPLVWEDVPGNRCFHWEMGDAAAVDRAFAGAARIVERTLRNNRLAPQPIEARGAIGEVGPDGRLTLYVSGQGVHLCRDMLCDDVLGLPRDQLRVITPDVGGGFGVKFFVYPEYPLVLWVARLLGRPVKWIADRGESFQSDVQARDNVTRAALALDAEGRILGLRVSIIANMGAYLSNFAPFIPTAVGNPCLSGLYDNPAIYSEVRAVFTNTVPVDAYRGAGQPEASYVVERMVDAAARELGFDPAELRRRNFIVPNRMPFRTVTGLTYDSGEYQKNLAEALRLVDAAGLGARRRAAKGQGKLRGLGIATYIEATEGVPDDSVIVAVGRDSITVVSGAQSSGQGHETVFAQVAAERLGVDMAAVTVVEGDSDRIPTGRGTGGSRSLANAGPAIVLACDQVIAQGLDPAAELLEAARADIEFRDGAFLVKGTDRRVSLFAVAERAEAAGNALRAEGTYVPTAPQTFPNGCHACELEIDEATGRVEIVRYVAVNDFGRIVNPMIVRGQVHGGTAQGIGQALLEDTVYDAGSGQLLSGSYMDYCLPRADNLPPFTLAFNEVPSPTNPLGLKGCGESGCIAAPSAVVNAALDALSPLGVRHIDMPLTAERVWRVMRAARGG
ncbi:MAG: xanthine dehydrogenase family protein molybdopterin-binding subunit [Alphaproteobacteria bacterium]|nr:xanthine dehydrogenase family protein molybdopterin-binding subunit [Alphaproteobacteria bacterium]